MTHILRHPRDDDDDSGADTLGEDQDQKKGRTRWEEGDPRGLLWSHNHQSDRLEGRGRGICMVHTSEVLPSMTVLREVTCLLLATPVLLQVDELHSERQNRHCYQKPSHSR